MTGCTIATPDELKKRIRQRVYTCNRPFPKNDRYRCHVLGRMVKRALLSPATRRTMSGILDRLNVGVPKRDDKVLQEIFRKIVKYKTSKNYIRWSQVVKELKKKSSIRAAAKRLNISYTTLYRLITKRERERKITEEDKLRVFEFYKSSRISLQLPFKKYARYHYLRSSLAVAYEQYLVAQRQSGGKILSRTSVYRCLKGKFRTRRKIPFKDCQCRTCLNNSLLVDALIVAGVKGICRSNTQNLLRSYCPLEKKSRKNVASRKLEWELEDGSENTVLTDHNRDCIFRECDKCGAIGSFQEAIRKENPDVDRQNIVLWHQWEKVEIIVDKQCDASESGKKEQKKKLFDKIRYTGTLAELLGLFTQSVHNLSAHLFHFRWQAFQFDECKKLLQDGDVLMIMDFAQNHSHHRQDEVQSGLWSRQHTTLHPIVTYYTCQEDNCDDLVKEELMMLSEDLKHDGFAVNSFIEKAIEHLMENNIPVKRLIIFSDNCGPQYKSCKVFETLSRANIPVLRNYFGASHGKGEADGSIGRLSMTIDAVVRSGTFELGNCKELAAYCRQYLTLGDHKRGMCCHYHKYYYELSNIVRVEDDDICTIKGTLGFHSVRNTGIPGHIEVRESSCFCEQCFLGSPGECRNKRLVKSFRWASLYKVNSAKARKIGKTLQNVLWKGTSSKYIHVQSRFPKKRTVRLKDKSGVLNERREINNFEDNCDWDEFDELDSDFEDDIPLCHLIPNLKDNESAISSRTRTRTRLNVKPWVRTEREPPNLDLDDYENSNTVYSSSWKKKIVVGSNDLKPESMMLSGIHPLTPATERTPTTPLVPENDILITNYGEGTSTEGRKFADVKNSTPKRTELIGFTDMSVGSISPIEPVGESHKKVQSVKCPTRKDKKITESTKMHRIPKSSTPKRVFKSKDKKMTKSTKMHRVPKSSTPKRVFKSKDKKMTKSTKMHRIPKSSTPKRTEWIDLTNTSVGSISPIEPVGESHKKVQSVKCPTRKDKKITESTKMHRIPKSSTPKRVFKSKDKKMTKSTKMHRVPKSSTPKRVFKSKDKKMTKSTKMHRIPKSSTPKRTEWIDLTNTSVGSISPIEPVGESHKKVQSVKCPTRKDKKMTENTKMHRIPKAFSWQSLYNRFKSCKTYPNLQKAVLEECNDIPPLPEVFAGEMHVEGDVVDETAQIYFPKDKLTPAKFKHGYFPITIEPDGNCLLRSLSRFVYGVQTRHIEMRCRIVIDSIRNFENYTNHNYLVREASHDREGCHIGEFYCDYSGVRNSEYTLSDKYKYIQSVYKADIFRIRKEDQKCDLWQIHSAANVLNCKIWTLFPTKNIREDVRLDHHRAFLPKCQNIKLEFGLLWTALCTDATRYDHFVPLVKR